MNNNETKTNNNCHLKYFGENWCWKRLWIHIIFTPSDRRLYIQDVPSCLSSSTTFYVLNSLKCDFVKLVYGIEFVSAIFIFYTKIILSTNSITYSSHIVMDILNLGQGGTHRCLRSNTTDLNSIFNVQWADYTKKFSSRITTQSISVDSMRFWVGFPVFLFFTYVMLS